MLLHSLVVIVFCLGQNNILLKIFSLILQLNSFRITTPLSAFAQAQPARSMKHWNPKFKKLRAAKVYKVDLPDFNEDQSTMSPEKIRQKMKERGLLPPRPWFERQFHISCTGGIFEAYIPPEGDGRASLVSSARAKQTVQLLEKKSKSMMAVRKIRSFEEDFDTTAFGRVALQVYTKAHEAVASKDRHALRLYVTERAYPELRHNTFDKTIHWKMLNELEAPRLVHARCTNVVTNDNIYGQVTIRFHTQQQLAIYDRFGRLMHGSEILAKDVLEYVVFEKHLSDMYGVWRLHDKIIPEWAPPKDPSITTRVEEHEKLDVGISTENKPPEPSKEEAPAIADK